MPKVYSIVGMNFRSSEPFVAALDPGVDVTLVREPENPFDPLAVAVWINGVHVGYIPKKTNQELALRIDREGVEQQMAMDSAGTRKTIPAKFIRSPNHNYPQVVVSE
jgi:hypothetical protein